ncbi:MAG: restriction endonuclease [Lachnospiraceae bacterium]|uniref:Restriction endonuclease n=1 Tax=Candidatus Weimeria bifida TaxID=2599074 RepID=A0A6N7IZ30_9FIRM|nr:restriction endonuclease [Candidatus Weimeria bifida]RRF96134.1 MAG: restriction endonuclease [Lachnospiraceae bacterium]
MSEKKLFDYVIGNPPYQEDTTESTRKRPVYNSFMDGAYCVADKVELITPARFLFDAGQTPKDWNRKMLDDSHFKVLKYEADATKVFPNTDIKGGVAVTYHNFDSDYSPIKVFTKFEELNSILSKVIKSGAKSIDSIVSARGCYRLNDNFFSDFPDAASKVGKGTGNMVVSNIFEKVPEAFYNTKPNDDKYVKIIGREKNRRTIKFINAKYLIDNGYIYTYNVLISEANNTGKFGETLVEPQVASPAEGATDTFISIGFFDSLSESENAKKYLKTKFCRAMLGVKKATQHTAKSVWKYVPLQNFTNQSDIDWSKSIHEIDLQLYRKYGLDENEINFIETHVKEMA